MSAQDIKIEVIKKIINFGIDQSTNYLSEDALTVSATALASEILDMVQVSADDMAMKATGECDICFGKGYLKEYRVKKIKDEDGKEVETTKIVHGFCKCDRGRALKKLVLSNIIWVDAYEKNNQ